MCRKAKVCVQRRMYIYTSGSICPRYAHVFKNGFVYHAPSPTVVIEA
jgi:hypothetical protein